MKKRCIVGLMLLIGLLLCAWTLPAVADNHCKQVRFSDVGWTDITATTALTSAVFKGLGYEVKTNVLAVPVTFASLKNKDIDVFLGLWMPSMTADIKPGALPVSARKGGEIKG
jgi:glycine betaine/proline transport system substrate-binding protein